MKGYAVTAGVGVPLWGGTGMFAVGYADVEACDNDKTGFDKAESTRLGASIGYDYPFSKRTNMYVVGGYYQDSIDNERYTSGGETYKRDRDPTTGVIVIGMRHKF